MILTESLILSKSKGLSRTAATNDFKKIKSLNLWGQNLNDISVLRDCPGLEVVSLAVNSINDLSVFQELPEVRELYLRKNKISDPQQLLYLRHLPLTHLWIADNPVCQLIPNYRLNLLRICPNLQKLDDQDVTDHERMQALQLSNIQLPPSPTSNDNQNFKKDQTEPPLLHSSSYHYSTSPPSSSSSGSPTSLSPTSEQTSNQVLRGVPTVPNTSPRRQKKTPFRLNPASASYLQEKPRFEDHLGVGTVVMSVPHVQPNGYIPHFLTSPTGIPDDDEWMGGVASKEKFKGRRDHLEVGRGVDVVRGKVRTPEPRIRHEFGVGVVGDEYSVHQGAFGGKDEHLVGAGMGVEVREERGRGRRANVMLSGGDDGMFPVMEVNKSEQKMNMKGQGYTSTRKDIANDQGSYGTEHLQKVKVSLGVTGVGVDRNQMPAFLSNGEGDQTARKVESKEQRQDSRPPLWLADRPTGMEPGRIPQIKGMEKDFIQGVKKSLTNTLEERHALRECTASMSSIADEALRGQPGPDPVIEAVAGSQRNNNNLYNDANSFTNSHQEMRPVDNSSYMIRNQIDADVGMITSQDALFNCSQQQQQQQLQESLHKQQVPDALQSFKLNFDASLPMAPPAEHFTSLNPAAAVFDYEPHEADHSLLLSGFDLAPPAAERQQDTLLAAFDRPRADQQQQLSNAMFNDYIGMSGYDRAETRLSNYDRVNADQQQQRRQHLTNAFKLNDYDDIDPFDPTAFPSASATTLNTFTESGAATRSLLSSSNPQMAPPFSRRTILDSSVMDAFNSVGLSSYSEPKQRLLPNDDALQATFQVQQRQQQPQADYIQDSMYAFNPSNQEPRPFQSMSQPESDPAAELLSLQNQIEHHKILLRKLQERQHQHYMFQQQQQQYQQPQDVYKLGGGLSTSEDIPSLDALSRHLMDDLVIGRSDQPSSSSSIGYGDSFEGENTSYPSSSLFYSTGEQNDNKTLYNHQNHYTNNEEYSQHQVSSAGGIMSVMMDSLPELPADHPMYKPHRANIAKGAGNRKLSVQVQQDQEDLEDDEGEESGAGGSGEKLYAAIPPAGYICKLCYVEGHWLKNCTLYRDRPTRTRSRNRNRHSHSSSKHMSHATVSSSHTRGLPINPLTGRPFLIPPSIPTSTPASHFKPPSGKHHQKPTTAGGVAGNPTHTKSVIPPDGYVCRKCNTVGHWIQACPNPVIGGGGHSSLTHRSSGGGAGQQGSASSTGSGGVPPEGYLCKICNVKGHWIWACALRNGKHSAQNASTL
ncbi:hypothetical protein HDV05_000249 [Chytridiales sp. JEL 0842]|nr:hypothetical protein HDV05_000249 [Chytridiales sp. JEL 0842]